MDKEDKIEVGDIVSVAFNGSQFTLHRRATVLSIPFATGDSWVFKDFNTGDVSYVSEGCTIMLVRKAELEERLPSCL